MSVASRTAINSPLSPDLSDAAAIHRKTVGRAGPWQLVSVLAETDFSRLYAARAVEGAESVPPAYAVKMLRKEWWRDTSAIELFRREAWVGTKVCHPHVVPILSVNVRQPPFYLAMPLLPGSTLREKLDSGWRPSTPEALWITRQVVEGLAAIDSAVSMVHGDVKPDNVLVAPSGHATLIDLGFCRSPEEGHSWTSRPLVGSLAYIAPEVVTSAYAASPQSDQYGVGVMLFELLAGRLPFESEDPAELVAMHRGQKPPCLGNLRPDLPRSVTGLVHTLLAKDPLRRFASLAELTARLVRLEIDSFAVRQGA
jgi:eukaryotic-like serine/threonine-protein kinase